MGVRLSDMVISPSHLKHLFEIMVNNFLLLVATPAMVLVLLRKAAQLGPDEILSCLHGLRQVHVLLAVFLPFALATLYLMSRPRSVYLVDYSCCRPNSNCRVSIGSATENARFSLDDGGYRFMARMLKRSGLGDQTYVHPSLHYIPPGCTLSEGRDEAEQVIFAAVDDLLAKTGICPEAIDILVTNCTAFTYVGLHLLSFSCLYFSSLASFWVIMLCKFSCKANVTASRFSFFLELVSPSGASLSPRWATRRP